MTHQIRAIVLLLTAVTVAAAPAHAQARGGEKGQKQEEKANKGRPQKQQGNANKAGKSERGGNDKSVARRDHKNDDRASGGNVGRKGAKAYKREIRDSDVPAAAKRFAKSSRASERIAAGALARGVARGLRDDDIVVNSNGERVRVLNRSGAVLVDLDDNRARNLGNWRVTPHDDDIKEGAPSFCRSGAGHPNWGRQWCIDKGFGLGESAGVRWGRTTDVGDLVLRRNTDTGSLARDVLVGVLGDVVLNRLGLHAITMGYSDPLTGSWISEPTGPRVLRITSGDYPVAEIVDTNRDDRADALVVALRAW